MEIQACTHCNGETFKESGACVLCRGSGIEAIVVGSQVFEPPHAQFGETYSMGVVLLEGIPTWVKVEEL